MLYYSQWLQRVQSVQQQLAKYNSDCPRVAYIKLNHFTGTMSDISFPGGVSFLSAPVSCSNPRSCGCYGSSSEIFKVYNTPILFQL